MASFTPQPKVTQKAIGIGSSSSFKALQFREGRIKSKWLMITWFLSTPPLAEVLGCQELHAVLHLVLQAGNILNAVSDFGAVLSVLAA